MITRRGLNGVVAALIASTGVIASALADVKDYDFELIGQTVKIGPRAVITVRLVDKTTKNPAPDAVVAAGRLDMSLDGMPTMTTKLESVPGQAPGTFQFRADIRMAGRWQLSVSAHVPGETGVIECKLVIKVEK
jgi:hypothetical protein